MRKTMYLDITKRVGDETAIMTEEEMLLKKQSNKKAAVLSQFRVALYSLNCTQDQAERTAEALWEILELNGIVAR